MKYISICLLITCMAGCSSDKEMRDTFGDFKSKIMVDKDGVKYIVTHNMGDNYTVKLVH